MAEALTTTFMDSAANGKVTLYENRFKKGNGYYGRFARKTIDTNILIARIQKRKAGTNELALQQTAGFLKEEILEALGRGEAVNVLDLGTMYISVNGKYNGSNFDSGDRNLFTARFTPSQLAQNAITELGITEIVKADVSPSINSVTDIFTQNTEGKLYRGKPVHIEGERLKLDDAEKGIFLCPLNEKKEPVANEEEWIVCPVVRRNTLKNLEFFVPEEAESGKEYRILVRTNYRKNGGINKTYKEGLSMIVTVE